MFLSQTSDEVMPVPIGAATMQSLVQWAAPSVLQEADLQSLLDMMIAADLLGLPVSDQSLSTQNMLWK